MKKFLSIILVVVLAFSMCVPFAVSAADPRSYKVPKAATAPTLDGNINADEWKGALVVELKKGDADLFVASGDGDFFGGAVFQFMWADEGIYFSVVSNGNNDPTSVPATGAGSYNAGNGVQFNMYPNRDITGATTEEMFFFSYHPKTEGGAPQVGEHFVYGDGGSGQDVPEAKIAAVMNGNDYTMEGLIPAAALAKSQVPIKVASGEKLFWNNVIMFADDGGTQGLIVDNEWFDGAYCNEYTLVDTLAGIGAVEETPIVAQAKAAGPYLPGGTFDEPAIASADDFADFYAGGAMTAEESLKVAIEGRTWLANPQFVDGAQGFGDEEEREFGEWAENLFDLTWHKLNADGEMRSSKYCGNDGFAPFFAIWKYDQAYVADSLLIATGNDCESWPRRMGDGWTFSGSNDGENWTLIYRGLGSDYEPVNFAWFRFDLAGNTEAFQWYRIYSDDFHFDDQGIIQMSNIALTGGVPGAEEPADAPAAAADVPSVAAPQAPAAETPPAAPTTGDVSPLVFALLAFAAAVLALRKKRAAN
ncbi:MAG: hypothetical protein FWG34_00885 [Oscillospiraceae bacterium]|nr:hypothetical protein [Oscillospiraceae bacterium]